MSGMQALGREEASMEQEAGFVCMCVANRTIHHDCGANTSSRASVADETEYI